MVNATSDADDTPPSGILRGVSVRDEPRLLVRAAARGGQTESEPSAEQSRLESYQIGFEQGKSEGFSQGHAAGYADGLKRAEAEMEKLLRERLELLNREHVKTSEHELQKKLDQLSRLVQSATEQISERVESSEEDVIELCFDIVCKLIGDVAITKEFISRHVLSALRVWRHGHKVTIHLNPLDLNSLKVHERALNALDDEVRLLGIQSIHWVADPQVQVGGCILKGPEGGLDARLETQLTQLKELLVQKRSDREISNRSTTSSGNTDELAR